MSTSPELYKLVRNKIEAIVGSHKIVLLEHRQSIMRNASPTYTKVSRIFLFESDRVKFEFRISDNETHGICVLKIMIMSDHYASERHAVVEQLNKSISYLFFTYCKENQEI